MENKKNKAVNPLIIEEYYVSNRADGTAVDADLDKAVASYNRTTNINNTSDLDKPVSTSQASAIAVVNTSLNTHTQAINPHNITAPSIGASLTSHTHAIADGSVSGFSNNDFTNLDKTKLIGIEPLAQVNLIESITVNGGAPQSIVNKNIDLIINESGGGITGQDVDDAISTHNINGLAHNDLFNLKVDKVNGKSLIEDNEINRLSTMEDNAQVNLIESITINGGAPQSIVNKNIDLIINESGGDITAQDVDDAISLHNLSATAHPDKANLIHNHNISDITDLQSSLTDLENRPIGTNVTVSGTLQTDVAFQSDPQNQINSVVSSVSGKQAVLVSGTNIKTINNTSILGSGNLDPIPNRLDMHCFKISDFNFGIENGWYTGDSVNVLRSPVSGTNFMIQTIASDSTHIYQKAIETLGNRTFERRYITNAWSAWAEIKASEAGFVGWLIDHVPNNSFLISNYFPSDWQDYTNLNITVFYDTTGQVLNIKVPVDIIIESSKIMTGLSASITELNPKVSNESISIVWPDDSDFVYFENLFSVSNKANLIKISLN